MHKMMADSPARKQPEGRDFCLLYSLLFSQHQDQYLIHNGCPINTYGLVEILTQVDNRRNCKKKRAFYNLKKSHYMSSIIVFLDTKSLMLSTT